MFPQKELLEIYADLFSNDDIDMFQTILTEIQSSDSKLTNLSKSIECINDGLKCPFNLMDISDLTSLFKQECK